jgi:molecular chaperone HtpG
MFIAGGLIMSEVVAIEEGRLEEILGTAFAPVIALSELIKNSSDACTVKNDTIRVEIDTLDSEVTVKDNGHGFSKEDIENLKVIGYSNKMKPENNLSYIGEPYAGSKGLGLLTAFFICQKLEILTFSKVDKCIYKINWEKGTSRISFAEVPKDKFVDFIGTQVTLKSVNTEHIKMLTRPKELKKLFLTSITFYKKSESLPNIEFYKNGQLLNLIPDMK